MENKDYDINRLKEDTKYFLNYYLENKDDKDKIDEMRSKLIEKHQLFFRSRAYKSRLGLHNKSKKENNHNIKKLKEVVQIKNNEELTTFAKLKEMMKVYTSSEALFNTCFYFFITQCEDEIISSVMDAYAFYALYDEKGVVREIERLNYIEENLENKDQYCLAKRIIKQYINNPLSYEDTMFSGNYKKEIEQIRIMNPKLYEIYKEKSYEDAQIKFSNLTLKFQELISKAKEGYYDDNDYEFLSDLPLANNLEAGYILKDLRGLCPKLRNGDFSIRTKHFLSIAGFSFEDIKLYTMILLKNKITATGAHQHFRNPARDIDLQEVYTTTYNLNGRIITFDEKEAILAFIKDNNLPMWNLLFNKVLHDYVDGNIDLKQKIRTK